MSGQRGPLSMVPEVRELHGNRHKRNDGVQAVIAEPSIPSDLDAEAKREWRRVVPELKRLRLLARTDRGLLSAYCAAWSEYVAIHPRAGEAHGSPRSGPTRRLHRWRDRSTAS